MESTSERLYRELFSLPEEDRDSFFLKILGFFGIIDPEKPVSEERQIDARIRETCTHVILPGVAIRKRRRL